ncbi:ABC transporter related protein [[Kitasatospora] papulosa]|uniref:ABC transporter related protein n=2 Tax=Streptomyces TaxID=1883 RepID=A0A8D4BJL0_STRFA
MHRPHHPERRPSAISSAAQAPTERGVRDADGESPLLLDDVTRALAFLDRNGALSGEV